MPAGSTGPGGTTTMAAAARERASTVTVHACLRTANQNGTPASHDTWNGCVTDRGSSSTPTGPDYDTNANAPDSSISSKFPAEQFGACPQTVMTLSYNWSSITTLVNNMS